MAAGRAARAGRKNLYEPPPEEALGIEKAPTSLDAVLDRLDVDHDYLVEGGVFTPDLIETWIEYEPEFEIDPIPSARTGRRSLEHDT